MTSRKRLLCLLAALASVAMATEAAAGSIPRTRFYYDNNGNLHRTTFDAFDPVSNTTVMTPDNCGATGNRCPVPPGSSATCSVSCTSYACSGLCGYTCNTGYATCGASCVVLASDVKNCGACGNSCPVVTGGVSSCVSGACDAKCSAPTALCPAGANAYVCVDVTTAPGSCGVATRSLSDEECVASPWRMVRLDAEDGNYLVAHQLQDCTFAPQLLWPTPTCSNGACQ